MAQGRGSENLARLLFVSSLVGSVVKLVDLFLVDPDQSVKSYSSIRSDRMRGVILRLESAIEIKNWYRASMPANQISKLNWHSSSLVLTGEPKA